MTTITIKQGTLPPDFPRIFSDIQHLKEALFQYDLEQGMARAKSAKEDRFVNL